MKRILLIQTAPLGDLVLTTPLLRKLRRTAGQVDLTLLTTATGARLLEDSPHVDRVWVYDKRWNSAGWASTRKLIRQLTGSAFDVAVSAHRSFRSGILLRLSGAPLRIGFKRAQGAWAYNRRVHWDGSLHAVRRYLALAGPLPGAAGSGELTPELPVSPRAGERVAELLASAGIAPSERLLCIAPGSAWPTKRWTPEGYAAVADGARARRLTPVLIGTAAESELCGAVAALAGSPPPVVLAGRTDLGELAALLRRAEALVGNDSGSAHVAAAVGTPVVSVFGPTVPTMGYSAFGDRTRVVELDGLACRPCDRHGPSRCPLGHHRCMREIGHERVLAALDEQIASEARDRAASVAGRDRPRGPR